MQFKDVIGQVETKKHLVEMVYSKRLAHALLFLSREGAGTLSLAMAFAQYVVCEKVNGKSAKASSQSLFEEVPEQAVDEILTDSCGECAGCLKAKQFVHPDIHYSYPTVVRSPTDNKPVATDYIVEWRDFVKQHPYGNVQDWIEFLKAHPNAKIQTAVNKQGNITRHESYDIIHKLNLKSFESEYKVLIMWMPEFLGEAGNILLKLIEEPPPNTLFIFVAENEDLILPTILSRTQLVKIPLLSNVEVEAALELKEGINITKAGQIAALAEGNYREALQLLQHTDDDWEVMLREWLNAIIRTGPVAQVKWIDETAKLGREKQKQFLKYFIHLLEEAVRLRVMDQFNNKQPTTANDFSSRLNKLCNLGQQEAIINELDKASYYIERNANAKMLFHALSIRLYHIISNKSLILVN